MDDSLPITAAPAAFFPPLTSAIASESSLASSSLSPVALQSAQEGDLADEARGVLKGEEGEEEGGQGEREEARGVVMGDSEGVERGEREDVRIVSCAGRCEWGRGDAGAALSDCGRS